jgi:DNA modification methylase
MAKQTFSSLAIEHLSPARLRPDPRNPRSHKPPQVAAIARSIQTFGFNMPVLIDSADMIIAGHGRIAAALKLGLAEVPAIRIGHLSDDQRRAYMIADNRLSDVGTWNTKLLGEVLRDLTLADLDFELDAIGFSVGEIDLKIEALDEPASDADEPLVEAGPPVTIAGDIWQLGRHRLICGDALAPDTWARLMGDAKAAMVFTDPPYNVPIQGHVSGLGKHRHREFAAASGEMDRDQFTSFLASVFERMKEASQPGSLHYVCMDWRHIGEMITAGEATYTELKNLCVWAKPSGSMGSLYRSQHELVFVWKQGRARHRNNVELGRYGRNRTNLWTYAAIAGFRHSEGGDLLADHPTCKPVSLVADAILDVTARGEIVIDPFMGSGTTLIAAERVGRVAHGIEIDPLYCDSIIRRFEAITGEEAIHADLGMSFSDLIAVRQIEEEAA